MHAPIAASVLRRKIAPMRARRPRAPIRRARRCAAGPGAAPVRRHPSTGLACRPQRQAVMHETRVEGAVAVLPRAGLCQPDLEDTTEGGSRGLIALSPGPLVDAPAGRGADHGTGRTRPSLPNARSRASTRRWCATSSISHCRPSRARPGGHRRAAGSGGWSMAAAFPRPRPDRPVAARGSAPVADGGSLAFEGTARAGARVALVLPTDPAGAPPNVAPAPVPRAGPPRGCGMVGAARDAGSGPTAACDAGGGAACG